MIPDDRESLLEEEIIILRNSGEIPEITLHSSIYYLEEDDEGPQIKLCEEELHQLYDAALARAREIVLRDLNPDNRNLSLYRGLARSIANWHRLQGFCCRINRQCPEFKDSVSQALLSFIEREYQDTQLSLCTSSVNCTADALISFCDELSMDVSGLPDGWSCLCKK